MTTTKRAVAFLLVAGLTMGTATTAFAGDTKGKCNSGRGNSSETTPDNDCDPGNSGGHNSGGD